MSPRRLVPALNDLQPEIIAQATYPQTPTPAQRARYIGQTRRAVSSCTTCELHKHCTGPVSLGLTVRKDCKVVFVQEVPSFAEDRRGELGSGPNSRLLWALAKKVGIPKEQIAWTTAVSCYPNKEGKPRVPRANETLACRGNLLAQVEAGYTPFVLLVGGRALDSFRSDLTVADHHGEVFVWLDSYIVMPIHSPGTVLAGQRGLKSVIEADLAKFWKIIQGGDDPLRFLGEKCAKCGLEGTRWDRDGVPYCEKHWEKWSGQWEIERKKWNATPTVQLELI